MIKIKAYNFAHPSMSYEELLRKISTLRNYYVCSGVEEEIAYLYEVEGMTYEEIWDHFQILDEDDMFDE